MLVTGKIAVRVLGLIGGALMAAGEASAAWLTLSPPAVPPVQGEYRKEYFTPSGERQVFRITPEEPDAQQPRVSLPVSPSEILWAGLIPHSLAKSIQRGALLQGTETGQGFVVSEIVALGAAEAAPPKAGMPVGRNLLRDLEIVPFGAEGRVTVRWEGERLVVSSRPGSKPAGVLFRRSEWSLPRYGDLRLRVEAEGVGEHEWGVSDAERQKRESPLPLSAVAGSVSGAAASPLEFPLPPKINREKWVSWSLSSPLEGGEVRLKSFSVVPEAKSGKRVDRGIWVWRPDEWRTRPVNLLIDLKAAGATDVYVTVPTAEAEVREPERLRHFIDRATKAGVRVWAVSGDPYALLPKERVKFVREARAFAGYNRSAPEGMRLAGVQYDIEPYLVPGYTLERNTWNMELVRTYQALKQAAQMPVLATLPFWFAGEKADGMLFMDRLAGTVDGVVVMDYQTEPRRIVEFAEPFLEWGERTKRPVWIALEAGKIDNEAQRRYWKAAAGELWKVKLGEETALVLLKRPAANPHGPAFRFGHASVFNGSVLTFHGRKNELTALLPALEAHLSAWPAFSGLALHEYLDPPDTASR